MPPAMFVMCCCTIGIFPVLQARNFYQGEKHERNRDPFVKNFHIFQDIESLTYYMTLIGTILRSAIIIYFPVLPQTA